jgi:uncharacterized protein (DUF697 family)
MPSLTRGKTGVMGRLALFNQLVGIVREIRVDDVRREAELRPVLLVIAPDREQASDLGHRLVGWSEDRAVVTRTFDDSLGDLNRFDLIVAFDPDEVGRVADIRMKAERSGTLAALVRHDAAVIDDADALEATRRRIVEVLPDRAVAFGRAFPPFRPAAMNSIVRTTARANAQFALITNVPAIVPIVGSMFAAGADMLILTKNQVLLLFKVAAIHGRDLNDTTGILRETLPVVGSGLLWRTLAREAVSFLPLLAGTIPKVAIAYAGTFAVGRAADYYYRFGHAPTRAQRREFYEHGAEQLHKHDGDLVQRAKDLLSRKKKGDDVATDETVPATPPNSVTVGTTTITEVSAPESEGTSATGAAPAAPAPDPATMPDGTDRENAAASTEGAQHATPSETGSRLDRDSVV